jgi:hypothetical protein
MRLKGLASSIFAAAILSANLPATASATDLSQRSADIEELDAAGKKVEAYKALTALTVDYYQTLPFQVSFSTFVKKPPTGYAEYDEYEGSTFTAGDTIYLYAEPLGVKWVQTEDNHWQSDLLIGVKVISSANLTIVDIPRLGEIDKKLHQPQTTYYLYLYINDIRLPAGQYTFEYIVTDKFKNESATIRKGVTIR